MSKTNVIAQFLFRTLLSCFKFGIGISITAFLLAVHLRALNDTTIRILRPILLIIE